jgi:hypothetical protein
MEFSRVAVGFIIECISFIAVAALLLLLIITVFQEFFFYDAVILFWKAMILECYIKKTIKSCDDGDDDIDL